MAVRLMGIETEYAVTGSRKGAAWERGSLVADLLKIAKQRLVHMPDMNSQGMFLQNGSRFYVDAGFHPELSTPECRDPWDVVRYVEAGERILAGLMAEIEGRERGLRVLGFKCNVDYSGAYTTWGCHESYLHRGDCRVIPKQIVPHLVSRPIYTGAGGFNSQSYGLEFMLSPRVSHLVNVSSSESTKERGIFHTKNESLSRSGYSRLHVICGESQSSRLASFLKVGTTALVVAMIEGGLRPGDEVELQSPVQAMRSIAADPECKVLVPRVNRGEITAIAIQRHYLALAEAHSRESFMPPWAPFVCAEWRKILDRLEQAPSSVETTLDWAIKHALYKDHFRQAGLDWSMLPALSSILVGMEKALKKTEYKDKKVSLDFVTGLDSPIRGEMEKHEPVLRGRGLSWESFAMFLELRQRLFEIDLRFGQLGESGIFNQLDQSGVLNHQVEEIGIDRIDDAVTTPPAGSRAIVRGEVIRRVAGTQSKYRCDWQRIFSMQDGLVLDLSDPFESSERWQPSGQAELLGLFPTR